MRWARRSRFVVFDGDFAEGRRFVDTLRAWRADASRSTRLHYIGVVTGNRAAWPSQLRMLVDERPPLTPDLHRLTFDVEPAADRKVGINSASCVTDTDTEPDAGSSTGSDSDSGSGSGSERVELLLAFGDPHRLATQLVAEVDAFFVDGASASSATSARLLFKRFARIAAPMASLSMSNAPVDVAEAALSSGFKASSSAGQSPFTATYEPVFTPRRPASRSTPWSASGAEGSAEGSAEQSAKPAARHAAKNSATDRHAIIIGGGLAGCSAAAALAAQGWTSTILERRDSIAAETSGNAGGLFHGIVNPQDGAHARFNRAAALEAAKAVRRAIASHGASGQVEGLLRLETVLGTANDMQRILDELGLPRDYVEAVSPEEASRRSGLEVSLPGWWYVTGGWVDPAALAHSFLRQAGDAVKVRTSINVGRLERVDDVWSVRSAIGSNGDGSRSSRGSSGSGSGSGSGASDGGDSGGDSDSEIARCGVVVLANAGDCERLARGRLAVTLASVRGQVTMIAADTPGLNVARVPVAGAGYVLPPSRGVVLTGATSHDGDDDPTLRPSDTRANLEKHQQLTQSSIDLDELMNGLTGTSMNALHPHGSATGRVGWRCVAPDRLPLIGAVPRLARESESMTASAMRLEQPRMVPREPGLFVFGALGSRGITWSALGARILASWITGAPFPVDADLVDAVDAARFVSRRARRSRRSHRTA